MKVVIIEDEDMATRALTALVEEVIPNVSIAAKLQSIEESVEWFEEDGKVDLVFMDIHLADGSSFSIFDEVEISAPIIFTTAYDRYALKAFEVNSVDYLLKPIKKSDLERSINKLKLLTASESEDGALNAEMVNKIIKSMQERKPKYRNSLLVAFRDRLIPLKTEEIAFIHTYERVVTAYTFDLQEHILEQTMQELIDEILNPHDFIRANRQFIVSRRSIKDISTWFGGRLSVNLIRQTPERIYVSKARANEFKEWMME